MVKSKEQAMLIQTRRAALGKRDLAPAVKRYLKRVGRTVL